MEPRQGVVGTGQKMLKKKAVGVLVAAARTRCAPLPAVGIRPDLAQGRYLLLFLLFF